MAKKVKEETTPEIPKAKFEAGQFVWRTKNGGRDFVRIGDAPSYTETRGWVYAIEFTQGVNLESIHDPVWTAGGGSCWYDEQDFEPLDPVKDAVLILRVRLREESFVQDGLKEQLQESRAKESAIKTALAMLAQPKS